MDSAPFNYGRQNAQHIAAASIHSYFKYIQNSGKLQWGYGFFDSRLREGGDRSRSSRSSTTKRFNPRLPEGGDTGCVAYVLVGIVSIHASPREATVGIRKNMSFNTFQSTPPRGRRRSLTLSRAPRSSFNPRLREGGDPHAKCFGKGRKVSIHASAREATHPVCRLNISNFGFNPRLREGGDSRSQSLRMNPILFQSTPPRGRRLKIQLSRSDTFASFNPRLREGGDN